MSPPSGKAPTPIRSVGPLELTSASCCLCNDSHATPIAVGEDFEYHTSPDLFLGMRCDQCGLVYLNPRPAAASIDDIYPPNYHAYDFSPDSFGFVYSIRRRLEARRILKACRGLGDTAKILDVGCGDGFHLRLLKDFGKPTWQLKGVDVSARAVSAANRSGLDVILGDVTKAELSGEHYDLILLIATVEHVGDPLALLTSVRRLLKPNGRVLIVTDNTRTVDFRIFGRRHWGGYHFPRHWHLFNADNLRLLAQYADLEVRELGTIVSPVNWVYSIRNRLVDAKAPEWMSGQFSLKSSLSLAFFTVVDTVCVLSGNGALLRMVAARPQ